MALSFFEVLSWTTASVECPQFEVFLCLLRLLFQMRFLIAALGLIHARDTGNEPFEMRRCDCQVVCHE